MSIDVSIIIVNWNTRDILQQCLKSIYGQTEGVSFQVIVVDNASADGSPKMIKTEFPQVVLVSNDMNMGFGKANNIGYRRASGKYICLVNSDVIFIENCVKTMFEYMESHPDVGILGPKLLWPDNSLQLSCREFPSLKNTIVPAFGFHRLFPKSKFCTSEHMAYFDHASVRSVDALVGAFLMVPREAIEKLGLFDESYFMYCEEVDLCRKFNQAGWKVTFLPFAQVIHIGRGSSKAAPIEMSKEYYLSNLRYWRKYHPYWEQLVFEWIIVLHLLLRCFFLTAMLPVLRGKKNPRKIKWKANWEVLKMMFNAMKKKQ